MKKSTSYAPYTFAFLITVVAGLTTDGLSNTRNLFRRAVYFLILVGLWRLIDWLLTRSENKVVQWVYVLLGISIYGGVYLSLDYYVFHLITTLPELSLWDESRYVYFRRSETLSPS